MELTRRASSLTKAEESDLEFGEGRLPCPFYGFTALPPEMAAVMMDSRGNGCPLLGPLAHSPCVREMAGLKPSWSECSFNAEKNQPNLQAILNIYRIAPNEHWPEGAQSWEGIPLREWYEAFEARR